MCDDWSETVTMHVDLVLIVKFTAITLHMHISLWQEKCSWRENKGHHKMTLELLK